MKSINARTTLKLVISLSWLIALAVVRPGYAGDYYIYQDPNGKLVISNYTPPQGSNVIKKETLAEVTDQEIMESRLREDRLAFDNRLFEFGKERGRVKRKFAYAKRSHNQHAGRLRRHQYRSEHGPRTRQ